jgi:alpha-beta hydrolase superfamily lysophospholipase/ribosome-associated toxin RatA of RatAB toxin-antitoxin module
MSTQVMNSVVNEIVVDAAPDRVYRACTDVERWPDIFPTVRAVRSTATGPDDVMMEMEVSNDLGENTVRSHRRYQRALRRIEFTMQTLPPAIAAMDGCWAVEPAGTGSRLVVVHNFAPSGGAGLGAPELSATLHRTTGHVLDQLRSWVESGGDSPQGEDWREVYASMREATGPVPATTFQTCELFLSRLGLGGVDWGDISMVLRDLRKENTHEDWADWHRRWYALGCHYEERARQAFASERPETGRSAIRRAAACFHFAEFFYFDAPGTKNATRARVTRAFEYGRPYLREHVRPLPIPYLGLDLPGYLMTPSAGPGPWPCVILINGLDSAKEVELFAFAREFLARGMAAVVFDGPGQGVLAGAVPMVVDFENVVGAVLAEVARQSDVDPGRVGVFGVSFGGYLAPRAAATNPAIRACISLSGGFDHDNYPDLNVSVRKDFRFVFGVADEAAMADLCRRSLNLRGVPPLRVPLLSVHPEQDKIITFESCLRLLDWAAGEKELLRYPGSRHVAPEWFADYIPRFCDWMAGHLDAVQP